MAARHWPHWFYGPDGEAAVFEAESDVPKGWHDHPSKHGAKEENSEPKKSETPAPKASKAAKSKTAKALKARKQAAPLDL